MTDRALFLLIVLGLMVVVAARPAGADEQPDVSPDVAATSSAPVTDRDTGLPDSPEDAAEDAYDAIRSGRWMVAAGFALWLLVLVARRAGDAVGGRWQWLMTDRGGATLALSLAIAGEVALLLTSGRSPSFSGFAGAVAVAFAAAGGRNLISRIVNPRDIWKRPPPIPNPRVPG